MSISSTQFPHHNHGYVQLRVRESSCFISTFGQSLTVPASWLNTTVNISLEDRITIAGNAIQKSLLASGKGSEKGFFALEDGRNDFLQGSTDFVLVVVGHCEVGMAVASVDGVFDLYSSYVHMCSDTSEQWSVVA
ncbi:hypothetical protein K435DRAFT_801966 [Dendrothele bispora CBS 962.96]|uniref:Uncharacterized protein n=1 Tax=Dendrothele bispora (strain CBS 962.96) TaxID=1314807 RepID=A0A4S8LNF7_DENBC|nr:hypothetical protein K435DRAFT_801966 [Dendrothele bispora CBS 962.96]